MNRDEDTKGGEGCQRGGGFARTHLEVRLAWSFLVLSIIAIAVINWRLYRTLCANCSKPIGAMGFWTSGGVPDGVNKCALCGVSFDSEMPSAGK